MDPSAGGLLARLLRWFFGHLYTDLAWSYDLVAWLASSGHWGEWQRVALTRLPPGRLLEVGHGPGHLLVELSRGGRTVIGIDPSRQMSRQAARRLQKSGQVVRLVRARAGALPFPAGVFDGVLSTFPSEYILETQAITSTARVLRSGGTLVVVPWARVTGRGPLDRLLARVYRWLAPSDGETAPSAARFLGDAFTVETESVACASATVLSIVARKRPE